MASGSNNATSSCLATVRRPGPSNQYEQPTSFQSLYQPETCSDPILWYPLNDSQAYNIWAVSMVNPYYQQNHPDEDSHLNRNIDEFRSHIICDVCFFNHEAVCICDTCRLFLCPDCQKKHNFGTESSGHYVIPLPKSCFQNPSRKLFSTLWSFLLEHPLCALDDRIPKYHCIKHKICHEIYCRICMTTYCNICFKMFGGCNHKKVSLCVALIEAYNGSSILRNRFVTFFETVKSILWMSYEFSRRRRATKQRVNLDQNNNPLCPSQMLEGIFAELKMIATDLKRSIRSAHPWDLVIGRDEALVNMRKLELRMMMPDVVFETPGKNIYRYVQRYFKAYKLISHNRLVYGSRPPIRVKKPFASNIIEIGGSGGQAGQLCRPWGVCCNNEGKIIVADRSNNRIQIYNSDGTFLLQFGNQGSGQGQFDRPAGITIDRKGNIVVADKDNHRIQILSINGDFIRAFGKYGESPGEFNYPWDVACNLNGDIVVSDTKNMRIQLFREDGEFLRLFSASSRLNFKFKFSNPRGVCFSPWDEIIVTEFSNHMLLKFDNSLEVSPSSLGYKGNKRGYFDRPQGIACDDEGNLVVADCRNNTIQVIDRYGVVQFTFGNEGPIALNSPNGVSLTPEGRIVIADLNDRVLVV